MATPIMDKLADDSVVDLRVDIRDKNYPRITVYEMCDIYFSTILTKEEYVALGNEILQEAKKLQ